MDYEDILLNLTKLAVIPQSPLADYFDSKLVSDIFKKLVLASALPVPLSRPYPPQAFEVKRISGDLDKLYRMGLLKRKRVKRLFRTSDGSRLFGRGYMYLLQKPNNPDRRYLRMIQAIRGASFKHEMEIVEGSAQA
jgi:hypothetical protein